MKTIVDPSISPANVVRDYDLIQVGDETLAAQLPEHDARQTARMRNAAAEHNRDRIAPEFPIVNTSADLPVLGMRDDRSAQFQYNYLVRWSFHNYTGTDVVVCGRDGLPAKIKFDGRTDDQNRVCFIIRKELVFRTEADCKASHQLLAEHGVLQSHELKKIHPLLAKPNYTLYPRAIHIDYPIDWGDLSNPTRCIYHRPSDFMVYIKSDGFRHRHPHSAEYMQHVVPEHADYHRLPNDVDFCLRYVSADQNATPKYIRVAGKTVALRPTRDAPRKIVKVKDANSRNGKHTDLELDTYVELYYSANADGAAGAKNDVMLKRMTLEEAKLHHGVFDSPAEAEASAEVYESRLRQLKDALELEQSSRKRELNEYKAKLDDATIQLQERDRRIERLKTDKSVELERTKEERDAALHRQRMQSEYFKFGALIATSVLVPLGVWLKNKSKNVDK